LFRNFEVMMTIEKMCIGTKEVGAGCPIYIVAEAGTNHDSSLEQARQLIAAAADAGVDAVKFQSFKAREMYPPNIGVVDVPGGPIDFYEYMRSREMPDEWLPELKEACDDAGVAFISTPFYPEIVPRLKECGAPAIKIASAEVTHIPLLRAVARTRLPVIISTGFSTLAEIDEAVRCLNEGGCRDIVLLQCIAAYPTPVEECNLRVMESLRLAFGLPAGFSDHTTDPRDVPRLVTALGGDVIEKHFTLDRNLTGPDHPFALEPGELRQMVRDIREVESWPREKKKQFVNSGERFEKILGCSVKRVSPLEKEIYPCEKRSIRARRNIARGETLTAGSIGVLRFTKNSKQGISPRYYSLLLGKKTACAVAQGDGVCWEDLLEGQSLERKRPERSSIPVRL